MENVFTYDYTYTTHAIIITKRIREMTVNIFANLPDEIHKDEALDTVLEILSDLYKCEGLSVSCEAGLHDENDLLSIGQSSKKRLVSNNNTYFYTTNALVITKSAKGMTIVISAELKAGVKKDEALKTVLAIIRDMCLSKICRLTKLYPG